MEGEKKDLPQTPVTLFCGCQHSRQRVCVNFAWSLPVPDLGIMFHQAWALSNKTTDWLINGMEQLQSGMAQVYDDELLQEVESESV